MISKSSKYAIKAVLYLALHTNEEKKVMVKDIAIPINVPKAYIAKLLQELSKKGIISSTRGPKGGFYLSDANRKNTIMDIIYIIDGANKLGPCMMSLKSCDQDKPCPLHASIYPIKTRLVENFKNKKIVDLTSDLKSGKTFLPL